MTFDYRTLLPEEMDASSRVWIYQSSRLFSISEAFEIEEMLNEFVGAWHSHGVPVKGYANLFYGQFIVLMADETASGVSGCSTDSSVKLMKEIEQKFRVQLFDRLLLAFLVDGKVQLLPYSQLDFAKENQFISRDTIYFNNTVQTKKELEEKWLLPLKESWLNDRMRK
ncbi:MAG TPA: hypothetical protein VGH64_11515 [Puia sp.]|jgi:hypothetical protein